MHFSKLDKLCQKVAENPYATSVEGRYSDKADQPGRTQAVGEANQEEVRKAAATVPGSSRQEGGLDFALA